MAEMNVSITLKLIDQLTAPAKKAIETLRDLAKAAKEAGQGTPDKAPDKTGDGGKPETSGKREPKPSTKAPPPHKPQNKPWTEEPPLPPRRPADLDKPSSANASEKRQPPTGKPWTEEPPLPPRRPADLDKPTAESTPGPRRRIRDYLNDVGDTPVIKRAALADVPQEAGAAAGKTGGIMGAAIATARQRVAATIQEAVADKLGSMANDYIASKSQALLDPVRQQLEGIKTTFPALAPAVDAFQGKMEAVAGFATATASTVAARGAAAVATRVGSLAAGMIGLPGLAIGAAALALGNWSKVKSAAQQAFASLPAPAQAAMAKIGGYLSQTPLAAVARGFDGFAGHVEKVFDAAVNGGEQRWDKLKQLLVEDPKQWMGQQWQGLKDTVGDALQDVADRPREALTRMANGAAKAFAAVPRAVANVAVDIAEALSGKNLSGVREAANSVVDAFQEIPGKLVNLGADIIGKIREGDWTGAATTLATGVVDILKGIPASLGQLANEISKAVFGVDLAAEATKMAGQIKSAFDIDLSAVGEAIINSLKAGLEKAWQGIKTWLAQKADAIRDAFSFKPSVPGGGSGPGAGGKSGGATIPGRAAGGPVAAGGLYQVGEQGPELFVPAVNGSIIPASDTRRLLTPAALLPPSMPRGDYAGAEGGRGGRMDVTLRPQGGAVHNNSFSIQVHGAPSDDPEAFARRMWDELDRVSRSALHDGVDK